MWEDPIVAEVHRTSEKLAAEYNYDIKAFFADLRKRQAALGARLVRQKPQPIQELSAAGGTGAAIPDSHGSKSPAVAPAAEI